MLQHQGLNQKEASELLGMSTHTVHDLYHGKSWASFAVVARIEQSLGATLLDGAYELTDEPAEVYQRPPSPPTSYLAQGERWPYGDLVDNAPAEARLAQAIAKNVSGALKSRGWSYEKASDKFKVSVHTNRDICDGERWVSFAAISRIDQHLPFPLWASSHRIAAESD